VVEAVELAAYEECAELLSREVVAHQTHEVGDDDEEYEDLEDVVYEKIDRVSEGGFVGNIEEVVGEVV